MPKVRFPSIKDVASCLTEHKRYLEGTEDMDVRLQVYESGTWIIRSGSARLDQDHNGFWGAGTLDRGTNCRSLAKDLIEEAKDSVVMCE